ncbi:hypothetical protein R50076_04180 [Gilvimarinus japonicus]
MPPTFMIWATMQSASTLPIFYRGKTSRHCTDDNKSPSTRAPSARARQHKNDAAEKASDCGDNLKDNSDDTLGRDEKHKRDSLRD